jgi:hypothetical protein
MLVPTKNHLLAPTIQIPDLAQVTQVMRQYVKSAVCSHSLFVLLEEKAQLPQKAASQRLYGMW